jgi:hypothetical protein
MARRHGGRGQQEFPAATGSSTGDAAAQKDADSVKTKTVNLGSKGSFEEKPGALHAMLGIPQGSKIPASDLTPKPGDSPLLRRRKASAKGFRSMAH